MASGFSALNEDGKLIYYTILSDGYTVEVCAPFGTGKQRYSGNIKIPDTVTYPSTGQTYDVVGIGENAFYPGESGVTISSITFPTKNFQYIGASAFYCCKSIENIEINSEYFSSINPSAFSSCTAIKSVNIHSDCLRTLCGFSGCESLEDITYPSTVTVIGKYAFSGCKSLKSFDLPKATTEIGEDAFAGCTGFESIDLPMTITEIGIGAFKNCTNLKSIQLPKITKIYNNTFYGCTSLTEITLPASLQEIIYEEAYYFYGAFENCTSLAKVIIEDSDRPLRIPTTTFKNSPIKFVYMGRELSEATFNKCKTIQKIDIGEKVKNIVDNLFNNCSVLSEINFGKNIERIGTYAFIGCSMSELFLPSKVTYLGSHAFYGCSNLQNVYIGNSLQKIDNNCFQSSNIRNLFLFSTELTSVVGACLPTTAHI